MIKTHKDIIILVQHLLQIFFNLSKQSPLIRLSCSPEPCILSNPRPDYLSPCKAGEATEAEREPRVDQRCFASCHKIIGYTSLVVTLSTICLEYKYIALALSARLTNDKVSR